MPRFPVVLLFLALAPPVTAQLEAQSATPIRVPFVMDTLPNGLRLIIHEDHSVPVATANVWFHVGSGDERPSRTGFAHLFEHLMFMGSQHAPYPQFDRLLEAAGAVNNGSTTNDRTNYFEQGPNSALSLMLWLEADRMGWLLPTMDSAKVDLQRDVVKNERRQSYENQPYGMVEDALPGMLYPPGHPYSWPVIGSMADLSAASLEDVRDFFRRYYAPNNAVIAVAGAVKADEVRSLARKYFADIPRGPALTRPAVPAVSLTRDTFRILEDRVQLPRLYYNWHTVKAMTSDDAALEITSYVLTGARNSRLTQKLVYDLQIATNAVAYQDGKRLDGDFVVYATARPGHALPALQQVLEAELRRLADEGPTQRELDQAKNSIEARFLGALESTLRKADQLNAYYYFTENPDGFQAEIDRLRRVTAEDVKRVTRQYLLANKAVVSVVPMGKPELAVRAGVSVP
ncbi:MAG: M16 family metallopeptidase [Gemmatimonadales bacterium]